MPRAADKASHEFFIVGTAMDATGTSAKKGTSSKQVLSFCLGDETYAVDILGVQEIRGWSPVTAIPQSPQHVLGVLNLRGAVVPVIDLRRLFGLEKAAVSPTTVIIVLSLATAAGKRECGLVVDGVSDVVDLAPDAVQPAPELGSQPRSRYVLGLACMAERMLIVLDAEQLTACPSGVPSGVAEAA
jgi:purine-binding chemotaxis protein CheW